MFIAFMDNGTDKAIRRRLCLEEHYGRHSPEEAEVLVALGGDGLMLQALHQVMGTSRTVYGMNCGTFGFLMNTYHTDHLSQRIHQAQAFPFKPLEALVTTAEGTFTVKAINEVSLFRQTRQAALVRVVVDGLVKVKRLLCDGILLSTVVGSTAYNFSAGGPILPLDSHVLALTPLNPFRARGWHGALLPHTSRVRFDILEPSKRPVSVAADHKEIRNALTVEMIEDTLVATALFDPDHTFSERVCREAFLD